LRTIPAAQQQESKSSQELVRFLTDQRASPGIERRIGEGLFPWHRRRFWGRRENGRMEELRLHGSIEGRGNTPLGIYLDMDAKDKPL